MRALALVVAPLAVPATARASDVLAEEFSGGDLYRRCRSASAFEQRQCDRFLRGEAHVAKLYRMYPKRPVCIRRADDEGVARDAVVAYLATHRVQLGRVARRAVWEALFESHPCGTS